ncbi:max-like protein X isoform X5 [Equus quagga]|uniref:max-like protein X isoform X5 n=1 Tax=Equus quagga TaxID=89248 RepID=UPI001EE37A34|nr:max-like protein X isoform X5 [Equus quagga]
MCFVSRRQGPTGRTSLKPPMLAQRQARPALRRRGPRAAHAPHPRPALRLSAVGWWAGVTWARLASSSRLRAGPRAGFRFGGSEMTEPGASPEDPWVKVEYAYSDNSLDPDDEDSDYHQESYKESYKDRRRRAHTQAEQKRRDAIKRGYDDLQTIVPTCQQQDFSIGSQKLSKAIVLQKTIDYIQFLHKEKKKQEEEVSILRKEVTALKIMKVNYEQIVKAHQDNPHEGEDQVSDQVKFNVFQGIMDSLFQSFNASISVASFQELSACVFSWIEEHCKPQVVIPKLWVSTIGRIWTGEEAWWEVF